jgi:processing peptidase subunit alpha
VTSIYNTTGLVGIFASGESAHAEEMIAILCREMEAVASDIPTEELERAKAAATSSILMNLESRAVVSEDIGRQILTYGHRKPIADFVAEIKAIKASDIKTAVGKLLKSPPTMATLGDIANVPRYELVAKRFS